ncbi:MAG: hypothetical protein EA398_06240 [Deltaproteobacteria bacterium]|nr:MAG: hypothetical protein EA398_06240 [Deltaproteobacteria bacterium]
MQASGAWGIVVGLREELSPTPNEGAAVMDALAHTLRHPYLPPERQMRAYLDESVPLAGGSRACPAPSTVARLLGEAGIEDGARVLVVGLGTGYPAALAAALGARVTAVESSRTLGERAVTALSAQGLDVDLRDGLRFLDAARPERFDNVVFCGSVPALPRTAIASLRPGGTLVVPVRQLGETVLLAVSRTSRGHRRKERGPIDISALPPALND